MKKRLVSLMLVLAMAFGLVACGGTTEEAPEFYAAQAKFFEENNK